MYLDPKLIYYTYKTMKNITVTTLKYTPELESIEKWIVKTIIDAVKDALQGPQYVSTAYFTRKDEVRSFLTETQFLPKEWVYTIEWEYQIFHELWPKASFSTNDKLEEILELLLRE